MPDQHFSTIQLTTSIKTPSKGNAAVLVVDLDDTLIASDMLLESFFGALANKPAEFFSTLLKTSLSKAAIKQKLASLNKPEATTLPINEDVLAYIKKAKDQGQKIALVSAADQQIVDDVAATLNLFDEAFGSDGTRNLGGANKAAFCVDRYGLRAFDYIGDHKRDLAVWAKAHKAVSVGASGALRSKIAALSLAGGSEHLTSKAQQAGALRPAIKAIRPHQWAKNSLVFLPVIAAHDVSPAHWLASLLAFVIFSATASSVYLLNDLLDLDADRAHPRKCNRPFANGTLPIVKGVKIMALLLFGAGILAYSILPWQFGIVMALYFCSTLAYSLKIKRMLMADIITLGGLYTLRVMAGGMAISLIITPWTFAFSGFLFLSLAAVKRQAELIDGRDTGRIKATGRAYEVDDLPIVSAIAITSGYMSVLVLALYASTPNVQLLYQSPLILWAACPILLYWVSRMTIEAHRGRMHDDPLVYAFRDPVSLLCGAGMFFVASLAAWV